MPDLGEGVAEGEIVRWLVAPGQEVAEDELLCEIQTDKATVEIPSPAAGVVSRILAEEGAVVPVGDLLVVIGAEDAKPGLAPPAVTDSAQSRVQATPAVRRLAAELGVDLVDALALLLDLIQRGLDLVERKVVQARVLDSLVLEF